MQEIINKLGELRLVDFQIRDCYWVDVTHINNPHDFYVRPLGYSKYLKDLEKKGDSVTLQNLTAIPIAIYESKTLKKLVRGKINSLCDEENSSPRYNMFAIDYGCIDKLVPINRIWLPLYKTNIESLAVPCKLNLCMPIAKEWSEKDIEGMRFFIGNESAQIRVCGRDEKTYSVELYSGGPDDVSTLMMYTGCSNFGYIGDTVNKIDIVKPLTQYYRTKQLIIGEKLHVRVQSGGSLKSFYVAQIDDFRQYRQNLNVFNDYCRRQNSPQLGDISIGHSYGVFLIRENKYERGVVKSINKNEQNLEVFLVDNGNTVTVPYEHLKTLKRQMYYELYSIAIHCTTDESKIWDNGLQKFLYPGFELYIIIKIITNGERPNLVDIIPLK